ncbi:hypothetical protein GLOIN_2v1727831 [Rhizophagus irregularis DAOM 181602=DAOM 197198]|nr:hypothetical protein GLOIN_2v1727831 [Rhizophagus irregularis DAOM 181602=DAOM 197198]
MFMNIKTSLFAIYLFLIGDSIVVYLMNLLIGLLNDAIEEDNNRVSYLMQKAEILAEIELFYLLPHQRRWQTWFPEVIHYYADFDKTRGEVQRLIKEDYTYSVKPSPICEIKINNIKTFYIHLQDSADGQ